MSKEFQIRDGNLIASFDLENEDGDIDFCKLLKVSHGVADEIGMFVDYVATNKIIKDQSKQIADLEAKLAESESKRKGLEEKVKFLTEEKEENFVDGQKYNELKQQLAESEKELKARYESWQEEIRECDRLRVVLAEVRKQLADTEAQNKRVLEKLDLIVRSNQELEKENMELASKVDLLESEKENLFRTLEETGEELAEKEKLLNQYPYKNDVIEGQYEELKNGIKFRIENTINDDWEQVYHCIDVLCEKHKARIRDIENGICKIEELEMLLKAKEKMKTQSLKGFEKLKQKLIEKDLHNKELIESISKYSGKLPDGVVFDISNDDIRYKIVCNLVERNSNYRKQLAEKEKLIEFYINSGKEQCDEINKLNLRALNYCDAIDKANQDKISFAVEQLEQLKHDIWTDQQDNGWLDEQVDIYFLTETIDNQIKQLKEMK